MRAGKAIVATDVPGNRSLLQQGRSGYLTGADPANIAAEIDYLLSNDELRRQLGRNARERKKQQRERVRKMLADSRSGALSLPAAELSSVPGLTDALNGLVIGADETLRWKPNAGFDLKRYESHIQAHIRDFPISLDELPPLEKNARKDRIWRFIAIIFLAHFGLIDIWQDGQNIMVMKRETNGEGQDVPGDLEGVDGLERSLGGIEAG